MTFAAASAMAAYAWAGPATTPASKKAPAKRATVATAIRKGPAKKPVAAVAIHKAPAKKPAVAASVNRAPAKRVTQVSLRTPVRSLTAKPTVARTPIARPTPAASRRGKAAPVIRTSWRNRQTTPTADRYKEIQTALVDRGFLAAGEANGAWGAASAEALKRFQAEQTLETTGRLDALSLIALGLGPRYDSTVPRVVDGNLQPESGRN